jgi:hypothetical protein
MRFARLLAFAAVCLVGCATAPDQTAAPGKGNALAAFADNKFNNWQMSPRFDMTPQTPAQSP